MENRLESFRWPTELHEYDPVLPVFMMGSGMDYALRITITATTTGSNQQWFTAGSPIYAVGSGESGLCWSMVRMKENP